MLDSSCWLEFFADSAQVDHFASAIEAVDTLVVPVLTVYEVVKKLAREAGDETAAAALGLMQRGQEPVGLADRRLRNGLSGPFLTGFLSHS